jgi:hypothetical protein
LLLMILLATSADAREMFVGPVTYVTDGDTLWVQPDGGGAARKLRLTGMDAPEICQHGGKAAHDLLAQLALHRRVVVNVAYFDRYGRGLWRRFDSMAGIWVRKWCAPVWHGLTVGAVGPGSTPQKKPLRGNRVLVCLSPLIPSRRANFVNDTDRVTLASAEPGPAGGSGESSAG